MGAQAKRGVKGEEGWGGVGGGGGLTLALARFRIHLGRARGNAGSVIEKIIGRASDTLIRGATGGAVRGAGCGE